MADKTPPKNPAAPGLMHKMAATLGLDLDGAVASANLPQATLTHMQTRCDACSDPKGCTSLLANNATKPLSEPPGFCRNQRMLAFLREHLPKA
ncbi:MAG: DUF6455 family protein [Paracoccaceae bacterium]|nr:DUF6455 family protein [Paracoccaceae bacterium]